MSKTRFKPNANKATTGFNIQAAAIAKLPKGDMAIINKLAAEFTDRSRKDIQSWRKALEAADNAETPRWQMLQDLYEYLRPDGHLGSQWDIRKGTTESNRFYIRDGKTRIEDAEKTKLLETEWFLNMLGELLDHIFLGYTVLQVLPNSVVNNNGQPTVKFDVQPRRNFIPQKNIILFEAGGDKGINITDPAISGTIIYVKNQYQFGILNDIVPDLIWKKNARQSWAEFSEKFGIPLVTATTNSRDKKELDRIEAMLKSLGKAAQALFPVGTTLDIKDIASKGDPYNVFLKQMEYNDGQISKRILGGTMVSDNGSSRSQSEVHERTLNYIIGEKDRKRIEFAVNNQLLPILRNYGFPFTDTDEFVFDRSESLTLPEQWQMVSEALNHYDIPDEWVSQTFGFPIVGRKQQLPSPGINATLKQESFFA